MCGGSDSPYDPLPLLKKGACGKYFVRIQRVSGGYLVEEEGVIRAVRPPQIVIGVPKRKSTRIFFGRRLFHTLERL